MSQDMKHTCLYVLLNLISNCYTSSAVSCGAAMICSHLCSAGFCAWSRDHLAGPRVILFSALFPGWGGSKQSILLHPQETSISAWLILIVIKGPFAKDLTLGPELELTCTLLRRYLTLLSSSFCFSAARLLCSLPKLSWKPGTGSHSDDIHSCYLA